MKPLFPATSPSPTATHQTNWCFNDLELPVEAEYRDDGTYFYKPSPDVTVDHLWACPNPYVGRIDLLADAYDWLMSPNDVLSFKHEIEGDLIQRYNEDQQRQRAEEADWLRMAG